MTGGIEPYKHMRPPLMGRIASEDFYMFTAAGLASGTATIIDFIILGSEQSLIDVYHQWMDRVEKSVSDYSFHVVVTW